MQIRVIGHRVGAALPDYEFEAIIVGETRPYKIDEFLHFSFGLFE